MCGRFTLHMNAEALTKTLEVELPETYEPDYNIGPGREILGISADDSEHAVHFHWGIATPQNFHINARLEKADTTPRFRDSWSANRCLVPANGFYEWFKDGVRKQPYYIRPPEEELLFFAGLWVPSRSESEMLAPQCVLLTTEAKEDIREIHHRMPVHLPRDYHDAWLGNRLNKEETMEISKRAAFAKDPVSSRVNSVRNNDASLIVPTPAQLDEQMQLF